MSIPRPSRQRGAGVYSKNLVGRSLNAETSEEQALRTAYHEAGHALVAIALRSSFRSLSIVRSSDSAGHLLCRRTPRLQRRGHWISVWIAKQIMILMGGMVAERLLHRDVVRGALDDLQKAEELSKLLNADANHTQVRRTLDFFRFSTMVLLWCPFWRKALDHVARTLLIKKELAYADCERLVIE